MVALMVGFCSNYSISKYFMRYFCMRENLLQGVGPSFPTVSGRVRATSSCAVDRSAWIRTGGWADPPEGSVPTHPVL